MLVDAIKTHALVAAQAGHWQTVAETLQAIAITAEPRLCYAVESGTAVARAGGDPTTLLQALLADPNGIMLFQKLSSSAGVMWSHPATVPYLAALVAAKVMTQPVMDALVQLSAPVTHPYGDVTAEQCQSAFETDRLQSAWVTWLNEIVNPLIAAGDTAGVNVALAGKQF